MAGRITIDNLSDSLKEVIEQSGLTDEQVIELIENNISGDLDLLNTNNKSSLVAAINELFQNANNGKELIANAIGEPLSAEQTFNAMSNDINGLLSQFKTNMMKNGVTVNSGDRFKALIDKLTTMTGSEGASMQYATGTITIPGMGGLDYSSFGKQYSQTVSLDLDFEPFAIFIDEYWHMCHYDYYNGGRSQHAQMISSVCNPYSIGWGDYINVTLSGKNVTITLGCSNSSYGVYADTQTKNFYAFGVGGEDTALRDSLASILAGKGVDVAEEDDMASLISKIEGIKSGGLDIISATELPTTGKENQLCVITDNPVDKFIISGKYEDRPYNNDIFIYTDSKSTSSKLIEVGDRVVEKYYMVNTYQGNNTLASYIYRNNIWEQLTESTLLFVSGPYYNTSTFGELITGGAAVLNNNGLVIPSEKYFMVSTVTPNKLDFSLYNKIKIKVRVHSTIKYNLSVIAGEGTDDTTYDRHNSPIYSNANSWSNFSGYFKNYVELVLQPKDVVANEEIELEGDISGLTSTTYFRLALYSFSAAFSVNGEGITFTSVEFI